MSNEQIRIFDTTLCHTDEHTSFKEKIDIIKKLDMLGTDAIEMPAIENEKADTLLLHTAAPLVKHSSVLCCSGYSANDLEKAWNAVKLFKKPGITVALPTSTVQMEFICHKKAPAMATLAEELVKKAASYGCTVEFKAIDAARAERAFLKNIVNIAIANGAKIVTLCDSTGTILPEEANDLIKYIYDECHPEDAGVALGAECSDEMAFGVANSIAALSAGARYVKTSCVGSEAPSLRSFADVINKRGEALDAKCSVNYPILGRTVGEIGEIASTRKSDLSPFDAGVRDSESSQSIRFTAEDDIEKVIAAATSLGYELSESDADKVFENVRRLAEKKPIGKREFEAVIATSAMQIPSTYTIKSYVINSGNVISATAHVELEKQGNVISGISTGDGPIDAAFLSIEQIIGRHFELDDFQIRAITEGREAVGEALVKIRHNGKLYSGRGVSTDIIGASIRAYVKALNKICYEEDI